MRDSLYDDTAVRVSLLPDVRAANGAVNGTAVDMAGSRNNFRVALLVVLAGTVTDGTHTVTLQASDDGATGWAVVPPEDREGSIPAITAANDLAAYRMGYVGGKRFLRAVITTSGAPATPVGGVIGAVILMSAGSGRPIT